MAALVGGLAAAALAAIAVEATVLPNKRPRMSGSLRMDQEFVNAVYRDRQRRDFIASTSSATSTAIKVGTGAFAGAIANSFLTPSVTKREAPAAPHTEEKKRLRGAHGRGHGSSGGGSYPITRWSSVVFRKGARRFARGARYGLRYARSRTRSRSRRRMRSRV